MSLPPITSIHNPKIQRVRALLGRRSEREEQSAYVVEGVRLLEEAAVAQLRPQLLLFTPDLPARAQQLVLTFQEAGVECLPLTPALFASVAGTESPQGLLAVLPLPAPQLPPQPNFVVIADNLRDPGNLGTLLRTSAAAGAQAVLLSPGCADAFSPKVVRSAMGAHFRLPLWAAAWDEMTAWITQHSLSIFLADANLGRPYWQVDLRSPLALVIGSEAEGPGPQSAALASGYLSIPMPGRVESLNAAVAAGILLFEVARQRAAA